MTLHKHWNAPAHADEPAHIEVPVPNVAPIAPTSTAAPSLTHVYIGRYYDGDDSKTNAFTTREACVAWRNEIVRDRWEISDEIPDDAEHAAQMYFDHYDVEYFEIYHRSIKS